MLPCQPDSENPQGWRLHPFHKIVGLFASLADLARVPSNMVFVLLWLLSALPHLTQVTPNWLIHSISFNSDQHSVRALMVNSLLCLCRSTPSLATTRTTLIKNMKNEMQEQMGQTPSDTMITDDHHDLERQVQGKYLLSLSWCLPPTVTSRIRKWWNAHGEKHRQTSCKRWFQMI